jgi:hypothetical protein
VCPDGDKVQLKTGIVILVIIVVFAGGVWFWYSEKNTSEKTSLIQTPLEGGYLSSGEEETKVVLVDSNFSYGILPPDIDEGGCPIWVDELQNFKPGDACVIINGTIRNEYDEDYYICLSAKIYDKERASVGYMVKCPFVTTFVDSGDTGFFELYIKHDKQDIVRYDLSNWISEDPPP